MFPSALIFRVVHQVFSAGTLVALLVHEYYSAGPPCPYCSAMFRFVVRLLTLWYCTFTVN